MSSRIFVDPGSHSNVLNSPAFTLASVSSGGR
jgi:hypothetical protein